MLNRSRFSLSSLLNASILYKPIKWISSNERAYLTTDDLITSIPKVLQRPFTLMRFNSNSSHFRLTEHAANSVVPHW